MGLNVPSTLETLGISQGSLIKLLNIPSTSFKFESFQNIGSYSTD